MVDRNYIPGSKWLYFKLYTGTKTADRILTECVIPLTDTLMAEGCIDKYFFIRYSDPDFHLRLRLSVSRPGHFSRIFGEFYRIFEPFYRQSLISNILCDTYNREIERYGEKTMDISEYIFFIDSTAIVKLVEMMTDEDSSDPENDRWRLSLLLIDDMAETFGLNTQDKAGYMANLAENFKKEFNFTSRNYSKQLNDKYRKLREETDMVLERKNEKISRYYPVLDMRKELLIEAAGVFRQIADIPANEYLQKLPLHSYIHMTMNRLFRSKNRLHEMVIYEFMARYYKSVLARSQGDKAEKKQVEAVMAPV